MDKEYTELLKDMGLNSSDITQVKKMLKEY